MSLQPALAAEDALSALQHDVVLAKQKSMSFTQKVETANLALEDEKAIEYHSEADDLIDQLQRKGAVNRYEVVKVDPTQPPADRPPTFYQRQEMQRPKLSSDDGEQGWRWPKFNNPFQKKGMDPKRPDPYPPDNLISDGDALYRVAVSDGSLSLQEAVDIAVANNLQVRASKKNVEVADAKLTEAKRALFPTVQGTYDQNGGHVPGAGAGITGRFYKGESYKMNMTQPLYYGGELQNTVKQAEENLRVAKAEYKKASNDFIHGVRLAYFGAVKAEYNVQYQGELYEKVARILKQVRLEREQKLVSDIDALSVESQYYEVLYQLEAAKSDVLSANVAVRQALSLDIDNLVPVELKMEFYKMKNTFNELLGRAMENNADVRIKVFALEAARYGVEIYESKKKPHFDLRGSYGMTGEHFHDDIEIETGGDWNNDLEKEWFLGVHGSMPFGPNTLEYQQDKHQFGPTVLGLTGSNDWRHHLAFNLFDRFGAITDERTAEYALLQAKSDYQDAKHQVTLKLRDDYYSLQKFLIQIDSSVAKVRYQDKQNAILEYLLGLREASPATYVENLVDQAGNKFAFIQAVADYNTSLSSLSVSIGDPDFFEGQRLLSQQEK